MGCCLMALVGAIWPRIVIVILALFTEVMARGYHGIALIWPVLGFIFLPTTTLAYALVKRYAAGGMVDGVWLGVMALAFLHDLGQMGVFRRKPGVVVRPAGREKFVDPG